MAFNSRMSTKRKKEFSSELSRIITSGIRTQSEVTEEEIVRITGRGSSDNYVVVKDYAADADGFSVSVGDIVEAIEHDGSAKKARTDPDLEVEIGDILDSSAAKHKLSIRPRRNYADPRARSVSSFDSDSSLQRIYVCTSDGRQGWLPTSILMQTVLSDDSSLMTLRPEDSHYRREAVVKELIETEEEFGRDLQLVIERYQKPLDNPGVPRVVRDNKEIIFSNLKQIADFHNTMLIEGVKYYADQPRMLGKTFLRLERDFDKHVAYCRDEPAAQEFLQTNDEVREYFEELSQTLGDDKSISEHLKLPIQRINDYQLLLKELVKYSTRLCENCDDLQKALELMLGIPHRAIDNKFISNIEGYKGNIHKLGRLLTHEWYTVIDKEGKSKERYLFLFKARILVCKVRRISEDRSVFVLKDIIRLPEVEVKDHLNDIRSFELHNPAIPNYPITLIAHKDPVKAYWLKEIREYASDLVALAEHAADDLQVTEVSENKEELKSDEKPVSVKVEPPGQVNPESLKIQSNPEKEGEINPPKPKTETKPKPLKTETNPKLLEEAKVHLGAPKIEPTKDTVKTIEKRKDSVGAVDTSEAKKSKIEEADMSRRYSASRYSAASKVVEEYSAISSSRNGVSSYMESSMETRTSSSMQGRMSEATTSYETAITGGSGGTAESNVESKTARITLDNDVGKPVFIKTIEGCTLEPGEVASFECTLLTTDATTRMQWLKDNKPMEDKLADRVTTTLNDNVCKLEIQNVHESDSGIYIARALNVSGEATCTAQLIVQQLSPEEKKARADANAPIFLVRLKDTELLENTYLRFMIKVKGDPNPEMKFFKDGVLIDTKHERVKIIRDKAEKGFYELVIADVQKRDAGKYSCTAMNRYGEATCEAAVTVTDEKPLFAGLPEGLLELGTEPHFTWMRDGQPFDPEERFKVLFKDNEDTLALVFQHVKPEDAGLYTCVAQTSTGNISCSAELTVQGAVNQLLKDPEKPKLQTESKQSEVNVGGSAMLDLQVKGYPKPDIKWTKDGEEIIAGGRIKYLWEDEESLSLVIKQVTAKDAGVYKITAKNDLGEDSTQIELIVKSAPKVTKKQEDMMILIEDTGTMIVQIEATPVPQIIWYKDGQPIEESDRIKITKEGSDTYKLVLKNAKLTDAGSYSIVARNEINQTTEFWKVGIKCPPKIKKKLGEPRVINEGDTLNLLIEVESDGETTVNWYKDKQLLTASDRIKMTKNGNNYIFTVSGAVVEDAAIYRAEVVNKHGTISDETKIKVRGIPTFKTKLCDISANEGDLNIEFVVEVEGFPKPSVHWFLGDVEITEKRTEYTRLEEGDNYKLIIKEVKTELKGYYTCKVQNEYGENSSSSSLTVNTRPKLLKKLEDQRLKEGETLKLTLEVSATPDPEVKWYKDGEEVSADARIKITRDSQRKESYNLTVTLLKGSDGGVYEVRAENELGYVTSKSKITVLTETEENVNKKVEPLKVKAEKLTMKGEETREAEKLTEEQLSQKPSLRAEELESEGHAKLEKQNIQVIQGDNETITISVATTTSHEAILTGPDESHTISKMTTTKIECRELGTEFGPCVEEVASYAYTVQEENSRPQNGVLIEEFSEAEERKSNLDANRGVTIVSVSDDESTLKALSRDVSTEDMQSTELPEDQKTINGVLDELYFNGIPEAIRLHRITETIVEERSSEEPSSAALSNQTLLRKSLDVKEVNLPSQSPMASDVSLSKNIAEETLEQPQIPGVGPSGLSKETMKLEKKLPEAEASTLSRQNSRQALLNNNDNDDEIDEEMKDLLARVKRQRSVLDEILDKESGRESAPPHVLSTSLTDRTIFETQNTQFGIKASGLPRPDATWLKDGKPLRSGERVRISASGESYEMDLSKATLEDEGVYMCVLTNKLGEETVEGFLSVGTVDELRKPRFSEPLSDVDVALQTDGEFKAAFTADPVPDIIWYCKGNEIPSDDTRIKWTIANGPAADKLTESKVKLKIPKCTKEDTGEYTLKLRNKWGEAECSAFLSLLLKPEVHSFKDHTSSVDEKVEWQAIVKGNPKPAITWMKDGVELQKSERYDMEEDKRNCKYKLIIKKLSLEDQGVYTITAKNYLGEVNAQAILTPHTEAPTFLKDLSKVQCSHREDIDLKIRATGIPRPSVVWLKDGEIVKEDERHQVVTHVDGIVDSIFSIKTFSAEDVGTITCKANNVAGSKQTSCNLTMTLTAPSFGRPSLPRSAEVDEGEPLELKVKVDGSPIPNIAWFKDGEKIIPDEHVKITTLSDGTTKLTIDTVKPIDCGAYKLVVSNSSGENSSLCAVAVTPSRRKPSFTKPLEDVKAVVGQPMKLEAQILAFPNPQVQWFKDGIPLRHTKEMSFMNEPNGLIGLKIDYVRPEDAGTYSLTVSNTLGEITGTAKVEVEEREKRPEFVASLQPQTVVEGYPVRMEVKAIGKPVPQLKWLRNDEEIIPDNTHIKIISQPDGSHALVIDKATPEDAGVYQIVAGNTEGTASCKAKLEIASKVSLDMPEEKPAFISPMRDVSIEEGQPLMLDVSFVGNPIPDVSWTKDGELVKPSERVMMSCDGKKVGLEINPCEVKDAGVYGCKLRNPFGEDSTSASAVVRKVYQSPTFTQKFTDLQQLPTFDAKFPARITGLPCPDVSWYFNDKPILKDSDKYKIKRDGDACCLYVKDCTYDDSGRYRCRAVNKSGEAECVANLAIVDKIEKMQKVEPPTFLKKIGDCEVYRGMPAKFTACVSGYPEPNFEWYRNGDRIWPTDRIRMDQEGSLLRLTIVNVDELDAGKYVLKISNPHGEDSCNAEMVYESLEPRAKRPLADQYADYDKYQKSGIPLPLADRPIISRMMDRHLTLSWKPSIPIGPRVPVTYLVEMCELPDGDWFTARSGIRSCVCDIRNLEPFRDYKFRIRVENKYGLSDPSPFAQTYRAKLEPEPPKFFPYLPPGIDFRPETSPYFPKDFDIERPPHDEYAQAPRFLRQEYDTQYGVKNHNCNLFWFVYGYPKPKMTYYFNDQLIESGGRYDQSYTRNGQATLFINRMLERDEGTYEAVATNEHGEARQRVILKIAEYPTFIERPDEAIVMVRRTGQLVARVTGIPYPELKWYKDWKPIASSSRIRIQFTEPDTTTLIINEAITKDEGLYSISAGNVAGSISCSVMLHVEENEHEYGYRTYKKKMDVQARDKPFGDFYDLGDELGRGTQGVTYHAVERSTGRNYASKIMHGRGDLKPFMYNEMEAMNQLHHRKLLRLHDAFETNDSVTLVMELAAGGELVDTLTRQAYYTETDVARYIRQLLWGLEYIHGNHYAHLGLTLGDLLISHAGGDDLKIGDFGLARRISQAKLMTLAYGVPEYIAPEVTNNEGVSYPADMWAVGIITYILLSGVSPFRGTNDRETLTKIRAGKWDFDDRWKNISNEAHDFIRSLLVYNAESRIDVKAALAHPWLNYIDNPSPEPYRIPSENLKNYYKLYRDWYSNASCRKWYRRRKLETAFEHPSRMVYPPGHKFTPEPSVDRSYSPLKKPSARTWENQVPSREPIDTEIGVIKSESHYQNGPDTYLLQLRDTDFPVRLREYMKVACNRSPTFSRSVAEDNGFDWRAPIIRERRRFTDVMDEEIDDERRARINRYGSADTYTLRRLKNELGTRLDSYAEAEAMIESKKEGQLPFFREKPQICPIEEGKVVHLTCLAVGDPKPLIQWFKNDIVIQENNRIKVTEDAEGRSILILNPTKEHDIGIYKVVARNPIGQTVVRTRVLLATVPFGPDSPEASDVSDTEVLLRWKQPKYDGNSPVLCYNLQYKEGDSIAWIDVGSNIDHEFYLVRDLKQDTSYNFRLAARNRIGWSEKGIPSKLIKTRPPGCLKVQITRAMRHLQELTEAGHEVTLEEDKPHIDYSLEEQPLEWSMEPQLSTKYSFISELSRGQFSAVLKGVDKSTDRVIVAKILELNAETEKQVNREFEVLRTLRHERIAILEAAYKATGSPIVVFIMEKLQGADILTYFTSRHEYTENCVANAVTQVLDGLQYLHWRGYCHLDIQPDNVVMSSVRSVQVKLVDMGSAHKVSRLGTVVPTQLGHCEYRSPELYNDESVYPQTDIWMVGVLTYVLLSGVSPFRGKDVDETRQNISFVRYRFEYLFKELSQEATRFLMLIFKRAPSKRPMTEECHDHRWLLPTEYMIKKRERAVFLGNRLKEYSEEYHQEKSKLASESDSLGSECLLGSKQKLIRSTSIQEELRTTF